MGAIGWTRRDRTQLVKDILLLLSHGSLSKTKLQNLAGLNKRLFETYVENILVRYGLVEKRRVGRVTYYTLTSRGRAYLYALVISDVEVLTTEEGFAEKVSEHLLSHGVSHERGLVAGDEDFRLPVDFVLRTPRGILYVYLAATWVAAMAKHCAAIAVKKLTGRPVVLVAPEEPEAMRGNGAVPVIYYRPGSVEHAAAKIAEAARLASRGLLEEAAARGSRARSLVLV